MSVQDLLLGRRVVAHDVVRVYNAAHAGKKKVLLQGPLREVYSIQGLCGVSIYDI